MGKDLCVEINAKLAYFRNLLDRSTAQLVEYVLQNATIIVRGIFVFRKGRAMHRIEKL